MTREECLAKIPPKFHAVADALQQTYNLDWGLLFAYLIRVLPELLDILFNTPQPVFEKPKTECDPDLSEALCSAQCAAVENVLAAGHTLCAVHCAMHAAGCCHESL